MTRPAEYQRHMSINVKLIGVPEGAYRNCSTTPLRQEEQNDLIDIQLTMETLYDLAQYDESHTFGRDNARYLVLISKHRLSSESDPVQYDMSESACTITSGLSYCSDSDILGIIEKILSKVYQSTINEVMRRFMIREMPWHDFPSLLFAVKNTPSRKRPPDRLLALYNFPLIQGLLTCIDFLLDHMAPSNSFQMTSSPIHISRTQTA